MAINLEKGQKQVLPSGLSKVFMGLGWDEARSGFLSGILGGGGGSIDLDASAILLSNKNVVDTVSFSQKRSRDGSIKHSGDNLTGAGKGDDEVIEVDLQAVPATVDNIVFVITSYRGQKFTQIENCFARVVDKSNNGEIARYTLGSKDDSTAMIMARLYRHNGEWKMAALGIPASGRVASDLYQAVKNAI